MGTNKNTKKNNKTRRDPRKVMVSAICILLAILMALSLILMIVPANAVTQSDIDALQAKLELLESQRVAQEELVEQLAANKSLIVERKVALDMQLSTNRQEIEVLQEEIEIYDQMVEEKQSELNNAQAAEDYQNERLRLRMRSMEENGTLGYIAFLFQATSLSNLLSRIADITDIMHYDSALEETLHETKEEIQANKTELAEIVQQQDAIQVELNKRQEELAAQELAACELIANLETLSTDAQAEYDAIYAAEEEALQQQLDAIAALSAQNAAAVQAYREQMSSTEQSTEQSTETTTTGSDDSGYTDSGSGEVTSSTKIGSSGFVWPLDSTLITSTYGYRTAPTAGASTNHQAIDIDGTTGDPIYAAADGVVLTATYNSGLGYYVSIQHADNTTTRYSHMSSYCVSEGQSVVAGQIIGYVGSTGISTGDHLDYAIYVDGESVDPMSYYSGVDVSYW